MKIIQAKLNLSLIVLLVVLALVFGLLGRPAEMGLMIAACSIALAFNNIDRLQRFKGAGFEAEMRKAVEEAYATTENLRALAKPLVLSLLTNLIYCGRYGGMNEESKHNLKEELDGLSTALGIRDAEIESALHKFYVWHGIDYIEQIYTVMGQQPFSNEAVRAAVRALCDRNATELPPEEAVRNALSGLTSEELALLGSNIEDYAYYRNYRKMRRRK